MAHITQEQRYTIFSMLKQDFSKADIARTISKDKSVIYREINRNSDQRTGVYKSDLAQKKYVKRLKYKPKRKRFSEFIKERVEFLLREDYSPEQVVGTLKNNNESTVSVERIYQHIWSNKRDGGDLYTHLRRQGRRYRKRGNAKDSRGIIKNRISIENRPKIVEKRNRFGDLEVDLIIGKNHKEAIVTINDRSSGVLKMKKAKSKEADVVKEVIVELLEEWKPYIKTITSDNGKEFAEHEYITEILDIDYYFAHAYHSWERGSNENLNGLIRQYIPKKTDFRTISDSYINEIQTKLNNRPRKRYKYKTPIFVMENLLFNQKVAFVT